MENIIKKTENMLKNIPVTTENANIIINEGYRLLDKCKELRESRDNWRNKYENQP